MKKVFLLLFVIVVLALTSCGYSKEDLSEAEFEGYLSGFEEGYDLAKYEASGELEQALHEAQGEIERAISESGDYAYEYGYEIGYEDGYYDCLEEHGLLPEPEVTGPRARLERD